MIDPQACAARIILNDPSLAEPLFDLLIWTASQPDLKENADYDDVLDFLWLKLDSGREARDRYAKQRVA